MDKDYNYKSMERALPKENFSSVIDMKFSPDGDLYMLEYGSAWFQGNANSALVRIEYNAGNRKPVVEAAADQTAGAIPFTINLSSKGTIDYDKYDKGALKYEWKITSSNGFNKTVTDSNTVVTLDKPGTYEATLTVTDTKGEKNSKAITLEAGNAPPVVSIDIIKGNKTFFFANQPIEYTISVTDKEDGTTADSKIKTDQLAINFDYVPEGFDPIAIAQNHRAADERTGFVAGSYLISSNDCKSCHVIDKTSVGPSFNAVSEKYKNDPAAVSKLADKIINGGGGVWGEHVMAAHPKITKPQSEIIVKYILSLSQKQVAATPIKLSGDYITKVPAGENGKGGYLLRVAYTDKGNPPIAGLSTEYLLPLRNPLLDPINADIKKGTQLLTTPSVSFSMIGDNSYLGYNQIDLTDIKQIQFLVQATPNSGAVGGIIEVHLDAPDGKLIGQTEMIVSKPFDMARMIENMGGGKPKPGAKPAPAADKKPSGPPKGFDFRMLRKMMATNASAAIEPINGVYNVYFVFKNSKAGTNQPLMQMVEIQFQNTIPPPMAPAAKK